MSKEIYLIVFAPVYGPSGYAKLSRKFILGLDKLGVRIRLEPNRIWEPHKAILPPDEEKRLNELEKTIIPSDCSPVKLSIGIAPWFDKEYKYRKAIFKEVFRCKGGIIYQQVGSTSNFEVYFDLREQYRPSKSKWGRRAWTVNTLERAKKILRNKLGEQGFKIEEL